MKITLARAIKIRDSLDKVNLVPNLDLFVYARTHDGSDVYRLVKEGSEGLGKELDRIADVLHAKYQLRSLIAASNIEHGMQSLQTGILLCDDILEAYKNVQQTVLPVPDRYGIVRREAGSTTPEEFKIVEEREVRLEVVDATKIPEKRLLPVSVYTTDVKAKVEEVIRDTTRRRVELLDQRNKLNYETAIELPKELVETLKGIDLI